MLDRLHEGYGGLLYKMCDTTNLNLPIVSIDDIKDN